MAPENFSERRSIVVAFCGSDAPGWAPVRHLAEVAARVFDRPLITVSEKRSWTDILQPIRRRRSSQQKQADTLLFIAKTPRDLWKMQAVDGWKSEYREVFAWVFDSFWSDKLPSVGVRGLVDRVYVTSADDVLVYEETLRVPVGVLTWGTDTLGLGQASVDRDIDVLRIGRQPDAWDDDNNTRDVLSSKGIEFHGRPPFQRDPCCQTRALWGYLRRAKIVIAFSNFAAPAWYTHPSREYLTARWTDAAGAGCCVAGIPPKTDYAYKEHFFSGAVLDLETTDIHVGSDLIKRYLESWSPQRSKKIQNCAMKQLDWRWRLQTLAEDAIVSPPILMEELICLENLSSQG